MEIGRPGPVGVGGCGWEATGNGAASMVGEVDVA